MKRPERTQPGRAKIGQQDQDIKESGGMERNIYNVRNKDTYLKRFGRGREGGIHKRAKYRSILYWPKPIAKALSTKAFMIRLVC